MMRARVCISTVALLGAVLEVATPRSVALAGAVPGGSPSRRQSAQDEPRPSFAEWLAGVRAEAVARGIRQETVEAALSSLEEPLPIVIERDRTQAEVVLPLETYLSQRVSTTAVRGGRGMIVRHRALLGRVSKAFDVPIPIVVAIWGVESNYGRFTGTRPTIASLATLAWDPRRSTLFRNELFAALEILDRGDIEPARMKGSWAGAMGQLQFMPSSYLRFAEDFDSDGTRDIWTSPPDIFASIAGFLKGNGWKAGERWGREVLVPPEAATRIQANVPKRSGSCRARRDMTAARPLDEWRRFGVRALGGKPLPRANLQAALVSGASRHFLVYANYDVLLEYNCAHAYALGVALLSDRLQ